MFSSVVYIYLFVFSSAQTSSGAGHISFAFGRDSTQLTYYTKYRKQDGGAYKVQNLSYHQAYNYDRSIIQNQKTNPELVLQLTSASCNLDQLEEVSDLYNLNKPWTLFANNCTDAVKKVLRETKINPGLAFLISTPNELIEDLYHYTKTKFSTNEYAVIAGNLKHYLEQEPNAVPQTLFGKPAAQKNKPKQKEAILILTGFGSKYHSLRHLKKYFDTTAYDVYVPNYISRKSLEQTVFNLDSYWKKKGLANYEKVHVFAYIIGSWSINAWLQDSWLQTTAHPNIKSIVYDRSALQERAPYILISNYKIPNYFVFGPIMRDLHQTPYLPFNDSSIQKGLLLECYATGIVRKNQATAAQLGPYCFEPDCFGQQYQDVKYVPLNHDHMYTHPEVYGEALLHFFKYGHFGSTLNAYSPVANPFIKIKP
jgi:hypothetical protein